MSDGDLWTRDRWLAQVARDSGLPPKAFKIAYLLAGRVNKKTGEVWVDTKKMATNFRYRKNTFASLVDALVGAGHLAKIEYGPKFQALIRKE